MTTVSARDFGPIREGQVRLRPLTVFIGPNNSGKSYLATLVYALAEGGRFALARDVQWSLRFSQQIGETFPHGDMPALLALATEHSSLRVADLPQEIQKWLEAGIATALPRLAGPWEEAIVRAFGVGLDRLVRRPTGRQLEVILESQEPPARFRVFAPDGQLVVEPQLGPLCDLQLYDSILRDPLLAQKPARLVEALVTSVVGSLLPPAIYLPAARSGILHGHRALASFLVSHASLLTTKRRQTPLLAGVVADFVANLLTLQKESPHVTARSPVAEFVERELCKGTVDLVGDASEIEYPQILYRQETMAFPLHQTSSMVSELAPIVLFLKQGILPGTLLIIEEPEAHLHPEAQRIIARALARLVRAGVRVLVTTHSDYLLHQLSNLVQLGGARQKAKELGYGEDEHLNAKEVSVALFDFPQRADGSTFRELEVTQDEGIPQDEFVRIAEAIYGETAALQYHGTHPE